MHPSMRQISNDDLDKKIVLIKKDFSLTEKNFMMFAAKHYDNPNCSDIEEFNSDLMIPLHIKKLLTRYATNGILRDRLLINHFISFFNVFEPRAAIKILFYKSDERHYSYIKTILYFLNRCPETIHINSDTIINLDEVYLDSQLLELLENNVR